LDTPPGCLEYPLCYSVSCQHSPRLEEAGDDLFTFLRYPKTQWKALRTTNALERINGECRRRTKTQAGRPPAALWVAAERSREATED
jgi:transposase-like protein